MTDYFVDFLPTWARITFGIGYVLQVYPTLLIMQWLNDQSNTSLLSQAHLYSWIFTVGWIVAIFYQLADGDTWAESLLCVGFSSMLECELNYGMLLVFFAVWAIQFGFWLMVIL